MLGLALRRRPGAAAAREPLERAARLNPPDAAGTAYVGYARELLGDSEGAAAAYAEALRLDPALALARQGLARLAPFNTPPR